MGYERDREPEREREKERREAHPTYTFILGIVYIYSFLFNLCCESFTIKWFNSPQSIELCSVFGWSFHLYNTRRTIMCLYIILNCEQASKQARARSHLGARAYALMLGIIIVISCTQIEQGTLCPMTVFIICSFLFSLVSSNSVTLSLSYPRCGSKGIKLSYFHSPSHEPISREWAIYAKG